MPREIKSREEFEKLLPSATEIRVVRGRGGGSEGKKGEDSNDSDEAGSEVPQTKIKIRTGNQLYTFKTTEEDADVLVKGTKTPVVEY
jgi:hypothetical protein